METDIYRKLGERLNKNIIKLPLGEPVLDFLRTIFTKQQAEIAAAIPVGSHTIEALSNLLDRDAGELSLMLDGMADKGLVFIHENDRGQKEYSLPPFFPGIVEFQTMRGNKTPRDVEVAKAIKKMMEYLDEVGSELFKNPKIANRVIPAALRTLTVEKTLENVSQVMPFEKASEMIRHEDSIAAAFCHCRHQAGLTGNPCTIVNVPERTCFYFGKAADFIVKRGFGERVSQQECLEILKKCEEAGLVHNINNYLGNTLVLCNCCGCCCDFLVRMKKYRGLQSVARSNFVAIASDELCAGCGACATRCQIGALSIEDGVVHINENYCLGCGNCALECPSGTLTMVRRSNEKPIELKFDFPGLGV